MKSFEQIAKAMFEEWESYFVHCMERYEEVLFRRGWDGISRNEKAAWIAAAKAAHKEITEVH